jgi:hypothetical protein
VVTPPPPVVKPPVVKPPVVKPPVVKPPVVKPPVTKGDDHHKVDSIGTHRDAHLRKSDE